MEKVEEFTKSIEEMGFDTLRRYALSLQDRMFLREAHAEAMRREQEELIAKTMRKVIQEERKHFDPFRLIVNIWIAVNKTVTNLIKEAWERSGREPKEW